MSADEDIDTMNPKELKAYIKKAGLSHGDCFEISDLRSRARRAQIDAREKEEQKSGLRERKKQAETPLDEEGRLRSKVQALVAESGQVISGRGAAVILAEVEELKKAIEEGPFPPLSKKQMQDQLEDINSSLSFENNMEKYCGRVVQLGLLAMTIIPAILTLGENVHEFATRAPMVVAPASLPNTHVVITGGTGAVGLDLAIMLANSGADVVVTCHGSKNCKTDELDLKLSKLGLLRGRSSLNSSSRNKGWVDVWPLQLESFKSVRQFASRVSKEWDNLDLLVHNAATKDGCSRTVDGHELATQVNYLSPFLLTQLLLPAMKRGRGRVVHVTCDAALQQPDWLPWPFRRTQAEQLPRVDIEGLDKRQEGKEADTVAGDCSPLLEYGNSKLALAVHSNELNRRISGRGVSHAINPGAIDSPFGRSDSTPAGKPSMRSSIMSKLPPVWIATKVYEHTIGKVFSGFGHRMSRSVETAAKGVFHIATAPALGEEETGGGLFSDKVGPFTDCGQEPEECGRVQYDKLPAALTDEELATQLWDRTEDILTQSDLLR